ncbi:hypothetical protein NliqN6_3411 [Naganishia liquefaciens]|uniref:C2H2-type domain-containing protein n=1 Tax=Naganishia liquefaciens TaxID=104408 RepID=A0A8H3YEY8_9TREE|nr:hypothetical protein NliqN6_3411 [Naganishia liquefaciens]
MTRREHYVALSVPRQWLPTVPGRDWRLGRLLWDRQAPGDYSDSDPADSEYGSPEIGPQTVSCTPCGRTFIDDFALQDHLRDAPAHRSATAMRKWQGYRKWQARGGAVPRSASASPRTVRVSASGIPQIVPRKPAKDYECEHCSRKFRSFYSAEAHRIAQHPSERNHKCPFCRSLHPFRSAVTMHLESGECRSKITREQLDQHVWRSTKGRGGATATVIRHEPDSLRPLKAFKATEVCKNREGRFPCYSCPGMSFTSLHQLNQHLNTPKHACRIPDLYACPKCGFDGQTFSGLLQHVQMARCGARKHVEVKAALKEMTDCLAGLRV